MKIATTIKEVREAVAAWKKDGLTVGLVPTMGALHEGHAHAVQQVNQCADPNKGEQPSFEIGKGCGCSIQATGSKGRGGGYSSEQNGSGEFGGSVKNVIAHY